VVDYKNGYNVVEHEDNEQLCAYLLGKAIETGFSHELYRVTVVQPNAGHDEGRVRSFDMAAKELKAFQKTYRAGIERREEAEREFDDAEEQASAAWAERWLVAGDHCMFCDAQAVCPARIKLAQDQAAIDFADEPRELRFKQREEDVARIMKWAPQLEALIRAASG
jgi:hypothetical protein